MEDNQVFDNDRIIKVDLNREMQSSYIDYSMSVIVARALPDVRDGFKPVHRRILYGMLGLNNTHDKPYKKCARIVGEVLGKYHPHGDSSVYGALARLAQEWNMRQVLVDGQGNFGSVDGDSPAAMRYTEARLTELGEAMMMDLDKETVDMSMVLRALRLAWQQTCRLTILAKLLTGVWRVWTILTLQLTNSCSTYQRPTSLRVAISVVCKA